MSRHPFSILAAALLVLGAPRASAAQSSPLKNLDALVAAVLRDWRAPGIAVAVVKDGRLVLEKGYGVRELGRPDRVDEHTIFAIASTTKAFTAAALGMLVDQGLVSWDDRVGDRLPGFTLYDRYASYELTIRDLLSHRSGLPRGDQLWDLSRFDRKEILRRVRYLEPGWSFRSRYGYQNIMFLAAGEIIEAVTDTSWDEFLRHRIFEPLGMARTTATVRDLPALGNVATPHAIVHDTVVPAPWRDFDNVGGAGALNSSVHDMARWLRFQLDGGLFEGRRLLSDSVIRAMRTPHTPIPLDSADLEAFPEIHLRSYGLGWFLEDYRGRLLVRHSGSLNFMRTHVILVPEERLGVVAITNLNDAWVPRAVVMYVLDQYLGPRSKDWNRTLLTLAAKEQGRAREQEALVERERVTGTNPSHALSEYAGAYESPLVGTAVVREENGALLLEIVPHYVGTLEHWHYDTFRVTWRERFLGTAFVGFQLGRMGRVAAVDVEGIGLFRRQGS